MAQGKLTDGDWGFAFGQNSSISPDQLPPGFYPRSVNMVNRGAVVQTRPGYRCMSVLPEGRLQGGGIFKPKVGSAVIVFGVAGSLYLSEAPFRSYRQIPGIVFSSEAAQLYFKAVEQSVDFNPDGSLKLVDPVNLLVIQDGGLSPAAVFDGATATHQRGNGAIPLGGPMEWIGDRLWVANGSALYASDIGNPTSFTESLYIASPAFFTLPDTIVALSKTPSTDINVPQLLAFTATSTTFFQAGIRDRSLWTSTPNFQKEVFPKIGCRSQRSVVAHYGYLWWYSQFGLTSIDSAVQGNISSELPYRDAEMEDSKSRLSADLSGVACGVFENYLLVSVPYSDRYNRHTWVLDNTVLTSAKQTTPTWNSVWTGTRPVEWMSETINGENRIFYLSVDYDGQNRLWEAFTPDRLDNGCPITWWVELRGLNFQLPGMFKDFRYARFFLSELQGRVDLAVFWAGTHRGRYKKILEKVILATRGIFQFEKTVKMTDKLFSFKKQSRPVTTQDAKAISSTFELSSCDVESPREEFADDAFQLLVVGSGPAAIRGYIAYAETTKNDDDSGGCEENEVEENVVRFDGAASSEADWRDAIEQLSADIPKFTSVQFESLSQSGMTEIGSGEAESVISQSNADFLAQTIARRSAAENLQVSTPRIVSLGSIANEIVSASSMSM